MNYISTRNNSNIFEFLKFASICIYNGHVCVQTLFEASFVLSSALRVTPAVISLTVNCRLQCPVSECYTLLSAV